MTKADIIFEGEDKYIYRRWDGFPNTTLPVIKDLLKEYYGKKRSESLLDFMARELHISYGDEEYSKEGFGIHDLKKDKRDPWRAFSYYVSKDGEIEVDDVYNDHIYCVVGE